MDTQPVTAEAADVLEHLQTGRTGNLLVISAVLDGDTPVDVLASFHPGDGEDELEWNISPIAIIVTEESGLFDRLTPPDDTEENA